MMIWFAGILQNNCCNKINENKTKKNHWVVCGVFYIISRIHLHWFTCIRQSVFYCKHTNDYFFCFRDADDHYFSIFLDSLSIFFLEHIFWGGPLQDRTSFFSLPMNYFFGMRSWRNAWHHHLGSQKGLLNAG